MFPYNDVLCYAVCNSERLATIQITIKKCLKLQFINRAKFNIDIKMTNARTMETFKLMSNEKNIKHYAQNNLSMKNYG